MDPMTSFLEQLRTLIPDLDRTVEAGLKDLCDRFALVPRTEYDRQVAMLHRLEDQVEELEERLRQLESD